MSPITPMVARQQLTDHPHYKYRGCAPDTDDPSRAAGDLDLTVDAWAPYTGDGAEPQRDRIAREKAAIAACGHCPVEALCATYGNVTVVDDDGMEHLAEPEGILGGMLALDRHRALITRRTATLTAAQEAAGAAPVLTVPDEARTKQKRTLLRELARHTDPELVAYRAGMDLRTANWHRSALVTMLGLDREHATRDQLLAAAVRYGLLPPSTRIRPDGITPYAAAPTTDGARQRRIARGYPVQLPLPGLGDVRRGPRVLRGTPPTAGTGPGRTRRPAQRRLHLITRTRRTAVTPALTAITELEPAA